MRRNATSRRLGNPTTTPPADLNLLIKRARAPRSSISVLTIAFCLDQTGYGAISRSSCCADATWGKAMDVRDIIYCQDGKVSDINVFPSIKAPNGPPPKSRIDSPDGPFN